MFGILHGSILAVALVASPSPISGPLDLHCRATGGENTKVDLLEFAIDELHSSYIMRMYLEDKAGQPLIRNGDAIVTGALIALTEREKPGVFKTTAEIDRKTGRYTLRITHENGYGVVVSSGFCSLSSGNAI